MRKQSASELSRLASVQAEAMDDLCNIVHVTRSSGTYSTQSTETRTMVSGVACGIWFTDGKLRLGISSQRATSDALLVEYDAVLRLPSNQVLLITDEIQLIEKGVTVVSGTFRPVSYPVVSSSVQHVNIKRVVS